MLKLLLRALLLALPFAALLVWFEWKYSGVMNNGYVVKKHLLEQMAKEVEVLVLGSSHSYRGVLPKTIGPHVFNLAAPSQSLYYDCQLARKYVPQLPELKTVVLPVSYFSLEGLVDEGPESWRCYYYYRYFGLPHRTRTMAFDVRNFSLYYLFDEKIAKDRDVTRDYDEAGGLTSGKPPQTAKQLAAAAQVALARHRRNMKPQNLPLNASYISGLAEDLHSRGIRLILVTLPVTEYYRAGLDASAYQRMQETLQGLVARHGLSYHNYQADERFTLADFADGDHLNLRGAAKFSEILRQEVLSSPTRP